jgi:aspartyl protease family protein
MRRNPTLLWIAFGGLAVAFVALTIWRGEGSTFGVQNYDLARIAILVVLAVIVAAGFSGRGTLSEAVRHAMSWAAIFAVVAVGYTMRDRLELVFRGVMAELAPGSALIEDADGKAVTVVRGAGGHFRLPTEVNGVSLPMLFDTGASVVTLTHEDAARAGIPVDRLNYSVTVYTANGVATAARVQLESVAVGSIERRRIEALVAREGTLDGSLMGMSFLETLSEFAVRGNRLVLTP